MDMPAAHPGGLACAQELPSRQAREAPVDPARCPGRLHLRQPVHNGLPVPLLPAWQVEATSQGPRSEGPCLPALGRSEMVGPGLCSPRYSCTARCEHAPGPALHPPRTRPQVEVLSKTCWWPRGLPWLRGPMQAAGCPGAAGAEGGAPIGGWRGGRPSCGQTVGQRWAAGLGAWAPWGGGGASTGGTGFIPHGSWSGAEPWMLLAAPRCLMGGGCPEEVRTGFDCLLPPHPLPQMPPLPWIRRMGAPHSP